MSTAYARLAKSAAEHYVRTHELLPVPSVLPAEYLVQRACYVSIFENPGKRLRSLYGEPLPRQSTLAQEIIVNTVKALTADSRRIVRRPDLSYLAYGVALLGPLQRISDVSHLDPEHFGLYIRSDRGSSAVLLPQRAGVETPQDQIATAMRESGIDPHRETFTMYRFEVRHYDS